jgi:hypothetical protein
MDVNSYIRLPPLVALQCYLGSALKTIRACLLRKMKGLITILLLNSHALTVAAGESSLSVVDTYVNTAAAGSSSII